jgi:hypothetical protein
MVGNGPDTHADDLDPRIIGLAPLLELLGDAVQEDVALAPNRVSARMRDRLRLSLDVSDLIVETLGTDRAEAFAMALKLLAEKSQGNPEAILRGLLEKFKKLTAALADALSKGDRSDEVVSLTRELEEKEQEIEALRAELEETKTQLTAALEAIRLAEIAQSDILRLREELLGDLEATAAKIQAAVHATRERASDGALAAYLDMKDTKNVDDECLRVFQQLDSGILAGIRLFGVVAQEYEALSAELAAAEDIPSLQLYNKLTLCLGKLQALLHLQNQLLADQMGGGVECPNEWLDDEGRLRDFYAELGVAQDADEKAIKKAYKKLARQCHPDTHPGEPEKEAEFKRISQAYEVLSDEEKRTRYDQAYSQA